MLIIFMLFSKSIKMSSVSFKIIIYTTMSVVVTTTCFFKFIFASPSWSCICWVFHDILSSSV